MTADLPHLHPGTLQAAAQDVDANAKVSGDLLGLPPLLSNHPYRTGLEGLIIARRRCSFFLQFRFHRFDLFLSILRLTFLSVNSGMGAVYATQGDIGKTLTVPPI